MKKEKEEKLEDVREESSKNRLTALVLCLTLGFLGVHRLYAGKLGSGFLMMYGSVVSVLLSFVCLPIGLMCLVTMLAFVANDFTVIAFGQFLDCYGKQMTRNDVY